MTVVYKYKFCDGSSIEIQISARQNALLQKMDKQEKSNNKKHSQKQLPLSTLNAFSSDIEGNIIGKGNLVCRTDEENNSGDEVEL